MLTRIREKRTIMFKRCLLDYYELTRFKHVTHIPENITQEAILKINIDGTRLGGIGATPVRKVRWQLTAAAQTNPTIVSPLYLPLCAPSHPITVLMSERGISRRDIKGPVTYIETQLNSTVELICDLGLRLEFWCFPRLISLVSNLEMSKI